MAGKKTSFYLSDGFAQRFARLVEKRGGVAAAIRFLLDFWEARK